MTTTPTLTLTSFLLARIGEDETAARAATMGPWTDDESEGDVWAPGNRERICRTSAAAWFQDAAHIARHDPARVLAECAAKRRVLFECSPAKLQDYDESASTLAGVGPGAHGLALPRPPRLRRRAVGAVSECPKCGGREWSTASDGLGSVASVAACCLGCGYLTASVVDLDA